MEVILEEDEGRRHCVRCLGVDFWRWKCLLELLIPEIVSKRIESFPKSIYTPFSSGMARSRGYSL